MSSSEKPGQYVLLVDAFRFFKRPEELRLLSYLYRKLFLTKASRLWLKSFQPKYSSFEKKIISILIIFLAPCSKAEE